MATEDTHVDEDVDMGQQEANDDDTKTDATDQATTIDLESADVQAKLAEIHSHKPARSGYMLFATEQRKSDNKGGPIAEQSKRISSAWNALSETEHAEWNKKVDDQKKAYEDFLTANPEMQRILAAEEQSKKDKKKNQNISFPLATVKKIVLRDPDISRISKEAVVLINHCTAMLIQYLAKRVNEDETERRGSKTITEKDCVETMHSNSKYMFIRHVFKKNKNSLLGKKRSASNDVDDEEEEDNDAEPPKKRAKINAKKKVDSANAITRFFNKK